LRIGRWRRCACATAQSCCGDLIECVPSNQPEQESELSERRYARRGILSLIRSREDALNVVTDAAVLFLAIAAVLFWLSFASGWQNVVDASLYAVLALLMWRFRSPIAAVSLLLVAVMRFFVTVAQLVDTGTIGWAFVVITVLVLFAAIRSVEATLKLIGRFAGQDTNAGASGRDRPPAGGQ
jgi:uncharacterized membrane protein YdfJ with MMPL/SSD domain